MTRFTLESKPEGLKSYRKKVTVEAVFVTEPFEVETQEGLMTISPDTVDDWDGGYWLVYPADGSKPYTFSPSFARDNYVPV